MNTTRLFQVLSFLSIIQNNSISSKINHTILNKALFTSAYLYNHWGSHESRSGSGSTLKETISIRREIPELLKKLNIKILLDAACGDFNWMKEIDLSCLDTYIGVDLVPELIKRNNIRYKSPKRIFLTLDIINDTLPRADLILCRDCLQHLPNENIFHVIKNFKRSQSKYLLVSSYAQHQRNKELTDLGHPCRMRFVNLELPPFNFPSPIEQIIEDCHGKTLSLWEIQDLPDYE